MSHPNFGCSSPVFHKSEPRVNRSWIWMNFPRSIPCFYQSSVIFEICQISSISLLEKRFIRSLQYLLWITSTSDLATKEWCSYFPEASEMFHTSPWDQCLGGEAQQQPYFLTAAEGRAEWGGEALVSFLTELMGSVGDKLKPIFLIYKGSILSQWSSYQSS